MKLPFSFQIKVAATLLIIASSVWAEQDENIKRLTKPQSTINFGAGYLFNDNARFGQFNGLRDDGFYGIFNLDIVRRNDDTGTWFKLQGRNLGFKNRDIRLEHSRQGNWGYFFEFSQTPRYEPFTANTAVGGIGSSELQVPTTPTAGGPEHLKTERESFAFGINKFLPANLELQLHFKNEDKDGARIFGRGNRLGPPGPTAVGGYEFLPEPINYTTRIFGATLNYNGKDLQLSGGYYGTLFENKNKALTTTGGSSVGGIFAPGLFTPIALPPDNQAHQAFLSGGYSFNPHTRGTFKASYTIASQTDGFFPTQLAAPGAPSNLHGKVDTTLVQAALTSRPLSKLNLLANFRYEDREDKTPVFLYNPNAFNVDLNGNRWTGFNTPRSFRTFTNKFEASYALPMNLRLIGGIDYEHWDRTGTPQTTGHRNSTDELSGRVELRRSLAETLTGTISYIHSDRWGSHFLTQTTATGQPFFNLIAPINLADRNRDKVRLLLNWEPFEPLSVQAAVDHSWDDYNGDRNNSGFGMQKGIARNYSLDAVYTFSENLQANAWFSRNETQIDQASRTPAPRVPWSVKLENLSTSFGVGINGKPHEKLDIGTNITYSEITDKFKQSIVEVDCCPGNTPVPDIKFKQGRWNLFARYALQKNLGLRLDYILDYFRTNEWTWSGWTYTDGTRLIQDQNQWVNFLGISAYINWQ
ncbi:MtrB/PioB family decaheme-associated outer membrane protein [Nitrosomonas communis]|uniref:Decaheme-associated outer membrane protein, MtrB/PioB family n=1 Tax=Nitrosomonas communis TaxID=44574 RepID=A0A1I4JNL1_9PROT|nr:MtrB/PioB family decaheme-associated outer membrane protein [Nitrosomonas communis]SFL67823.1 decaheme-associated outer membrane protein, MtrB/PioB family [Nitrosomonas communis]